MEEGGRRRKTVGSPETKHRVGAPPFTPAFALLLLITHTGTKESTKEGFSRAQRGARDRRELGRKDRERESEKKRGSSLKAGVRLLHRSGR